MSDKQFNLEEAKVDQQLFYRIPYKYLEENKIIPVCEPESGTIQIAMANPDDIVVIDEIERILNAKLIVEKAPEEIVLRKIEQCHSGDAQSVEKVIQDLTEDDLEIIEYIREY